MRKYKVIVAQRGDSYYSEGETDGSPKELIEDILNGYENPYHVEVIDQETNTPIEKYYIEITVRERA
jgi:hypothetical protein